MLSVIIVCDLGILRLRKLVNLVLNGGSVGNVGVGEEYQVTGQERRDWKTVAERSHVQEHLRDPGSVSARVLTLDQLNEGGLGVLLGVTASDLLVPVLLWCKVTGSVVEAGCSKVSAS